jgi:hypothetical protein
VKTVAILCGLAAAVVIAVGAYYLGTLDSKEPPCPMCDLKSPVYGNVRWEQSRHVHGIELSGVPVQGSTNKFSIILTHAPGESQKEMKIWAR